MASKNELLGSGKLPEVPAPPEPARTRTPAWRFHVNCKEGILCQTDAQLDALDKAGGWVDHPGKVVLLPGHEDKFLGNDESAEKVNN